MKRIIFKYLNIKKYKNSRSGFVLLFAVTLSSILLAIALGVADVAIKELQFDTSAASTNNAFFAADSGEEYALFQDKNGALASSNFVVSGLNPNGLGCANVTVTKTGSAPSVSTSIVSKGYDVGTASCLPTNPNSVERELIVSY